VLPYDYIVPIFAASSYALARGKSQETQSILDLASTLRGASAGNHRCAQQIRLLESYLVPNRRKLMATAFEDLEHRLDQAVAGAAGRSPLNAGFNLSPVTFRSATCYLIVAARKLNPGTEVRISSKIAGLEAEYLTHRKIQSATALPRIRLSLPMREWLRYQPTPPAFNKLIQSEASSHVRFAAKLLDITKLFLRRTQVL
jgi:hypothetical protein